MALAGISAAVALLFVGLSVLVRYSTIAFYVAAGLALMVPLTRRYYLSAFFAYAVSAALGFVIAGDIFTVIGYVAYFGPIALISGFLYNTKLKWYFALIVKAVFINAVLAVLYFALGTFVLDAVIIERVPYWALAIIGTVILLAIDAVQVLAYRKLIPIIHKAIGRVNRSPAQNSDHDQGDDESPFDEDIYAPTIFPRGDENDQNDDLYRDISNDKSQKADIKNNSAVDNDKSGDDTDSADN